MHRAAYSHGDRVHFAAFAVALLAMLLPLIHATTAAAAVLDRVRQASKLTLGYRTDARPFSYRDEQGNAAGYSVALCQRIADQIKADLGLSTLTVQWVPVMAEDRFRAVEEGKIDLLCGAASATLTRRKEVSFSIPIFPGGIGALLRSDSNLGLRDVLSGRQPSEPRWRGSPAVILQKQTFSVVARTTAESWLAGRMAKFQLTASVVPVDSYEAGIKRMLDHSSNVFFGERAILLDAVARGPTVSELMVLDRRFTYEPIALALERNADDLRLIVDQALSRLFGSAEIRDLYAKWFGAPDEATLNFFQLTALPE